MGWRAGAALGAWVAFGSGLAANAQGPWYASGSIGGYFRESQSGPDVFHHNATPEIEVNGTDKRDFDAGVIGDLALGYRLAPHVRVEGEFGYTSYTGSSLNPYTSAVGYANLDGQTFSRTSGDRFTRYTGTANIFYDFSPVTWGLTPYIGAGLGASHNRQSVGEFMASNGATFRSGGGSSTQGLGMVEGGVAIPITRRLSLVPAYRYVHYFSGNEDVAHVAKVGLRYVF